jgi:DMSO/TMAO reductase YedYZ molybdopterin-dependent catalytic subunit
MRNDDSMSRRSFLRGGLVAGAGTVALIAATAGMRRAWAAEALSPLDPTAKALGSVEDAAKVDPAKAPTFKPGSNCGACALYQKAQAANDHAPCAAFSMKVVPAKGWCAAWVKAPA